MGTPASTSNYIYRMGTAPNTRAAVSQKNKVFSYMTGAGKFQQIGVLSEFGHDESRAVDPVRDVGFGDQIAELVPGVTEPISITINKTLLYAVNLFQVFGYKGGVEGLVRSLRHHRWPFDIKQELVFSELVSSDKIGDIDSAPGVRSASTQPSGSAEFTTRAVKALITIYEGCWMSSYNASYTADAALVAENSTVMATDVIDGFSTYGEFVDTGLAPLTSAGSASAGTSIRFASGNGANAAVDLAGFGG
jgi:hypothetical protein